MTTTWCVSELGAATLAGRDAVLVRVPRAGRLARVEAAAVGLGAFVTRLGRADPQKRAS